MSKHKLKLFPSGVELEVSEDQFLLDALRANDIYIKSSCGGVASCTDCIVKIKSGVDYLNSPSFEEEKLLGNVFHITKERLSCQTKICGDVEIDLSKHDKARDQERLLNKTKKFVRKKAEDKTDKDDRPKFDDSWKNHWEKDQKSGPKRMGGGKRPRPFKTDNSDENE